jgi:hypothetical protein
MCRNSILRISLRFLIQGMRIPLPRPVFPVYRFFFPVAVFANFGVRVYVSIVTGGSLTTKIIPNANSITESTKISTTTSITRFYLKSGQNTGISFGMRNHGAIP